MPIKSYGGKTFGGSARPPPLNLVTEGLKHISSLAVEGKYVFNVEAPDQEI